MTNRSHSYFLVMQDFKELGLEGIAHPELTRLGIVSKLASGDFKRVVFIHYIADGLVKDVTAELFDEAETLVRETAMDWSTADRFTRSMAAE